MGLSAAACRQLPWKHQGFESMQQTQGGNSIEQLLKGRRRADSYLLKLRPA